MRKFVLILLTALPLAALAAALQAYTWSSQAALALEMDAFIAPWGDWVAPWLYKLSPDLARGIGAFLLARNQWGWSWPVALIYGFPSVLFAAPLLVGGLCMIVWRHFNRRFPEEP